MNASREELDRFITMPKSHVFKQFLPILQYWASSPGASAPPGMLPTVETIKILRMMRHDSSDVCFSTFTAASKNELLYKHAARLCAVQEAVKRQEISGFDAALLYEILGGVAGQYLRQNTYPVTVTILDAC